MKYKNCICFVLDESGSMGILKEKVIDVYNQQIKNLINKSKELEQETRVSVFSFNDTVRNLVFDTDCLRAPDIGKTYKPGGNTALIDGTIASINDLMKIPQIHCDMSFLILVISDGENNISNYRSKELSTLLKSLPENFTVAFLAPDISAKQQAKTAGFSDGNIQIWDVNSKGLEEASETISRATDNFMRARTTGVRGTKNLFNLNIANLTSTTIKTALKELNPNDYMILPVGKTSVIREFVESWTKQPYRPGSAYYPLTKPEKIQGSKQICIQNKSNGRIYSGANARSLLSLPDYEVKVSPTTNNEYNIFIQSSSVNRKLIGGTNIIVIK